MTNPVEEEEEEVREEIVPGVARALSPMARRILAMNPGPVSYTHLTLPTILLV